MLGCFLIGQIYFYSGGLGANRNVSGKLGMKSAILSSNPALSFPTYFKAATPKWPRNVLGKVFKLVPFCMESSFTILLSHTNEDHTLA